MTGPIRVAGSRPEPSFRPEAAAVNSPTSGPATLPTATTLEPARQRCPAQPNADAVMDATVALRSASGRTTRAFLAPPSAWTRLPCAAAVVYTCRATGLEPTTETAWTCGWAMTCSATPRVPWTTLSTPRGAPQAANSSASRTAASGARSDGLSTNVLPQATATGIIHSGTMTGTLNG